jgi:hypothetical protein
MSDQPTLQLPRIPLPLFTLDPSQTGGRKARHGFEFQDQYTAYILAEHCVGRGEFYAARIEAVEDFEVLLRTESGWIERYYQIKSRQEGGGNWTIGGLDKEGIWTRFFWLYRKFLLQKFEVARQLELVIVVEGDLGPDLLELRDRGQNAPVVKDKLKSILSAAVAKELPALTSSDELVSLHIDNFLSSLQFESRVGNLRELIFNRLIQSGDLSPQGAQNALDQFLAKIREESRQIEPALITLQTLKEWIGVPERGLLQNKPLPDPSYVDRKSLTEALAAELDKTNVLLLHGVPKVGKSHFVSRFLDYAHMDQSYFWFTFSEDDTAKDRLLVQLATWVGQQTSVWQVKDDIERTRLHPMQAIDRLKKIPIGAAYLVFDDCHKAKDLEFLAQVAQMVQGSWNTTKIVLISEKKIPELRAIGIQEMAVPGFEPREGILFLSKLGLDVRDAVVELGLLCVQADGHPVLLRAIASELPQRPSPEEVTHLSKTLNSAMAVQPFLQVLSERLVRSLRSDAHRSWLARLASITFPFRRGLALDIARMSPRIDVADVDWNYLASQMLDQTSPDQYAVPTLLRPLLTSGGQEPSAKSILVASARYVFRNAGASKQINFWDFHGAILALVIAERYEEAAMWFSLCLASSLEIGSFKLFEILFMVLNGDLVQAHLSDPFARFLLLLAEIQMRLLNETRPNYSRILEIIRRIRVLPKTAITPNGFLHIRMTVHAVITMIHVRRLKDQGSFSRRDGRRAFAPLQTALRLALVPKEPQFISFILGQYGHLYSLEKEPDLELLKEALLATPPATSEISADSLVGIYAQFVISRNYSDSALELCERHSHEYRAARRGDSFFACEHAIATILHDRFAKPKEARERVIAARTEALTLGASSYVVGRAELLVADSYWAEKDYATSAEHYGRALHVSFEDEALNQWVRERLADGLILVNQFQQATQHLVTTIRKCRTTLTAEYKGRLYARLAYAYGLNRELRKAAITCQSLAAIARVSGSAQVDMLSATLCDWLLHYFEYSDPVIPRSSVQIKNSIALSDKYTAEQVSAWEARGPLFARALVLLGMIFELLQSPVRAEFLYRKGLAIFQATGGATPGSGEGLFFALRICRTQIKQKRFPQAASYFASATQDLFAARIKETPTATEAAAAFVAFTFIEPAMQSLSDSELVECFAALERKFNSKPHVRAWMLFREVELLFDHFLVQKGKSKLLEAEGLAVDYAEPELLLQIRHKKLFVWFEQMYSHQINWLRDVLEEALRLGSDGSLASGQETLGKNVLIIAQRMAKGPLRDVALKISQYGERWRQSPFIFSLLAIWTVSRHYGLRIAALDQIQAFLRSPVNSLNEDDFS